MWEKICVKAACGGSIENITAILINNGIVGMEIVDSAERVRDLESIVGTWDYADESLLKNDGKTFVFFYIAKEDGCEKMIEKIESELEQLEGVGLERTTTDDSEWAHEWKKHFKPIHIKNITIVPEWIDYSPKDGEVIFTLSHCSAFGTGQHATTRLCIEVLQDYILLDDSVLDIGCGSGILSIISLLIGAKKALAIDIDHVSAITATRENARINNVNGLTVKSADILTEPLDEQFDIIIANIVSDVIIELANIVPKYLKPEGVFISSGIIIERADEVSNVLKNNGFTILKRTELDGWCSLVCEI